MPLILLFSLSVNSGSLGGRSREGWGLRSSHALGGECAGAEAGRCKLLVQWPGARRDPATAAGGTEALPTALSPHCRPVTNETKSYSFINLPVGQIHIFFCFLQKLTCNFCYLPSVVDFEIKDMSEAYTLRITLKVLPFIICISIIFPF